MVRGRLSFAFRTTIRNRVDSGTYGFSFQDQIRMQRLPTPTDAHPNGLAAGRYATLLKQSLDSDFPEIMKP